MTSRKHITDFVPGDRRAYRKGCRCYPCSGAWSRYEEQRQTPGWRPFIDVEPVREHIADLERAGIPLSAISLRSGVSTRGLDGIRGLGPIRTRRIRVEVAERILAVRPEIELVGAKGYVDGTGTYRRLQALEALGFTRTFIGARLGRPVKKLRTDYCRRVRPAYAAAVRRLYDELWDMRPEQFGLGRRGVTAARHRATAAGWPTPLEWDDDEIDNPNALPRRVQPDTTRSHRSRQLIEDMQFVLDTTVVNLADRRDRDQVAERLGIGIDYLDKLLKEAHRPPSIQVDGTHESAAHTGEQVGVGEAAAAPGAANGDEDRRVGLGDVRQRGRLERRPVGAAAGRRAGVVREARAEPAQQAA